MKENYSLKDIISKDHILYPYLHVRKALFNVYEGMCQYCMNPTDFDTVIIEHIISRLECKQRLFKIFKRLGSDYPGGSEEWITFPLGDFWMFVYQIVKLDPPRDSLFNYMLSCRSCNTLKGHNGDILHPTSLISLLIKVRNNASIIRMAMIS